MSPPAGLEAGAAVLRVLGHGVRLALLACLAGGERSVGEIEARTGVGQPALSQQLAILRGAGLVLARREAKQVYYRIDPGPIAQAGRLLAGLVPAVTARPTRLPAASAAASAAASTAASFARIETP